MRRPTDSSPNPRRWLGMALLAVLLAPLALHAQLEAAPGDALAAIATELEVFPVSGGWVLVPRDRDASFRSLEVRDGKVAVDGRGVDREQLEELLGEPLSTRVLELAGTAHAPAATEKSTTAVAAPEQAAENEPTRSERRAERGGDRFRFGGVTVDKGESARDVTTIGGPVEVHGEVRGDVVAIGGPVEVTGTVGGEVTSVGGSVILESGSRVDGDVTSVGGEVERERGAEVGGSIHSVPFFGFDFDDWDRDWSRGWMQGWRGGWWPWSGRWHWGDFGVFDVFEEVSETLLLAVLALLAFLIAQRSVGAVAQRAENDPWKAGLVGFLTQVVSVPVLVVVSLVLIVSIIGIPVLILLLPVVLLGVLLAFLLGFSAVALSLGRWLRGRFSWRDSSPYTLVLAGVLAIKACSIAGEALSLGGGPIYFTAMLILLLGVVVQYAAWTVGLGAFVLHKLSPVRPLAVPPPPAPPAIEAASDEPPSEP